MDESEAIARLKRGDIGGLEGLVRLHQTKALRVAFLITRDHAMAEDVVQSAFIRIYERIHQFDDSRPFAPWFFRVVANDALKGAAKRDRHISLTNDDEGQSIELPSPDLSLDDIMEATETSAAVAATLDRLPPAQRTAIVLRYFLNLSDEEMSARLDVAPGTVRWRLSVARQKMRQLLPTWLGGPEILDFRFEIRTYKGSLIMEQTTKEQRFRQVLAEYAAAEVPESRDVWPALQRRLRTSRRPSPQVLNLTAAPTIAQPRWSFVAAAAIVILLAGMLSLVLPATLGQYSDHTFISPTKTFAAEDTATAVVRTSTPLPQDYGYVAPVRPAIAFVAEREGRPAAPATPYNVAAPTPAPPLR